jgi:hypothetical protein
MLMNLARLCLLSLLIACCVLPDPARGNDSESRRPAPDAPLFTGTLLSTRASTVEPGHWVVQPYFYSTRFGGLYNNNWRLQSAGLTRTNTLQTYLWYGLTNRIDVMIAPQWVSNHAGDESSVGFGDFPLQVGFQALRDRADSWLPDVRIWVQETFPTGRFSQLSPTKTGLTGAGGGSFVTTLSIGAQKLIWLTEDHAFRYRLNASYGFHSPVTVQGFNSYGGGFGTQGTVHPGSVTTLIIAGEYTLTRQVILALDIGVQIANATRFSGITGVGVNGEPTTVGKGYNEVLTVAPAVEYIWNEHIRAIAGPWFSLSGRNTAEFFGVVASIYLFI